MTGKELLYVDDALGHEQYLITYLTQAIGQVQDTELKTVMQQMLDKHTKLYQSFHGLL